MLRATEARQIATESIFGRCVPGYVGHSLYRVIMLCRLVFAQTILGGHLLGRPDTYMHHITWCRGTCHGWEYHDQERSPVYVENLTHVWLHSVSHAELGALRRI